MHENTKKQFSTLKTQTERRDKEIKDLRVKVKKARDLYATIMPNFTIIAEAHSCLAKTDSVLIFRDTAIFLELRLFDTLITTRMMNDFPWQ